MSSTLTKSEKIAILRHRQDEAIRAMEIGYGYQMPRAARKAKLRFERALTQQRNLEAGVSIGVRPRGLSETLVLAEERKRAEYSLKFEEPAP